LLPHSRDNVALPGLAAHFKKESEEERHHAELLMDYQVGAGAVLPRGDALYCLLWEGAALLMVCRAVLGP
jgi:hypothetical protein